MFSAPLPSTGYAEIMDTDVDMLDATVPVPAIPQGPINVTVPEVPQGQINAIAPEVPQVRSKKPT